MQLSWIKSSIIGLLACLLAGCSALRLAYDNGPTLAWWWLDGYVDFSREQAPLVRQGIDRWFHWHRATQLADYAVVLADAAQQVLEPVTPEQVCRLQQRFRDAFDPALDKSIELAVDHVPVLGEPQLRHIEQRYAKRNDEMREEFLAPDPVRRRRASVRRTVERAERLYGRLGDAQRGVIEEGVTASPFDPEAWLDQRQRRQRETIELLQHLIAERADRDQRMAGLRALVARVERAPEPEHRAGQARLAEYNCAFAARIHNAATPAQRKRAHETIKGWEGDLRALIAAQPG